MAIRFTTPADRPARRGTDSIRHAGPAHVRRSGLSYSRTGLEETGQTLPVTAIAHLSFTVSYATLTSLNYINSLANSLTSQSIAPILNYGK